MAKLPFPFVFKEADVKGERKAMIQVKSTWHLLAWVIFCHPNWIISAFWQALKDRVWLAKKNKS